MPIRYLKISLAAFVALLCLLYATQNVVNLKSGYQAVAYVASMQDHVTYPASLFPALTQPFLIWIAFALIVLGEYVAGLLAARGVWDLWVASGQSAEVFNASKTCAMVGSGIAVVVWFGLFAVIGGACFQMWQTEVGRASLEGAFQASGMSALILLFINMPDR